jgi:hypothetical protein
VTGRTRIDRLLIWYPAAWRARYGDEMAALVEAELEGRRPGLGMRLSLAGRGTTARVRAVVAPGRLPGEDPVRDGSLVVLGAFTVFCWAIASFQKLTEHFASSMPPETRALPTDALGAVQALAPVAGLAVVVGVVLALPALAAFLRVGGWQRMRRAVWGALCVSAVAVGATAALATWAQHLTTAQRNGADVVYSTAFLGVVALMCGASALWVRLAAVTARQLSLRGVSLRLQGGLAVVVTAAMIAMSALTATWWGSVAQVAPRLVDGGSPGASGGPVGFQIVVTMALMVAAAAVAVCGATAVVRGRRPRSA